MHEDLIFSLRFHQNWRNDQILNRAADALEAMQAELTLRRKSGSASDRLHNLCEGIAADADGSEWSREEWERLDAENLELRNEVKRLSKAQAAELSDEQIDAACESEAAAVYTLVHADLNTVRTFKYALRIVARAVIAADRALKGEKA